MLNDNLGERLRGFFRNLLGSRVSATLEAELLRTRNDYETRLFERQTVISEQRAEIVRLTAKLERCEMVLLPMVHGNILAPKRPMPTETLLEPSEDSWQAIQARWDKAQNEMDQQTKEN